MKGKMVEEIKANYTGQRVDIDYISTTHVNHLRGVTIMKDIEGLDGFVVIDKNVNDPYHTNIGISRILKIVTPDGKVWENPPETPKYRCKACGFVTTNPEKYGYRCPKPKEECWGYDRSLHRVGEMKFG